MGTMERRSRGRILTYVFLTAAGLLVAFPVLWMLSISLHPNSEVFTFPPSLLPPTPTVQAYTDVLTSSRYMRYFLNSYLISMAVTVISVVIALFTAYGFSRFDFRGNKIMNLFVVATQTVPRITLVIPYFIFITKLKLYDT